MPAYLIVYRESEVKRPEEMAQYHARTRQMSGGDWQLTPLVVSGGITPLEGQAPADVIMLAFPTVDSAKAWYNSPEYQAALPHRKNAADYRVIIVEGMS